MRSREAGAAMAVGWFLLALAAGAWIPRTGQGLFLVIASSYWAFWWKIYILISGALLVLSSYGVSTRLKMVADLLGISCWLVLALAFVRAELWGATIQAAVAIAMLNACFFSLRRPEL